MGLSKMPRSGTSTTKPARMHFSNGSSITMRTSWSAADSLLLVILDVSYTILRLQGRGQCRQPRSQIRNIVTYRAQQAKDQIAKLANPEIVPRVGPRSWLIQNFQCAVELNIIIYLYLVQYLFFLDHNLRGTRLLVRMPVVRGKKRSYP